MKKRYVVNKENHDKQDRKRHDDQDDKFYLAFPIAWDLSYPCLFNMFL